MEGKLYLGLSKVSTRLLLLEDDILLAETLIDLFEDEGYLVTHASNGQIALDIIFKERFDIYILDINVPLIDGITLLKELRESNDNTPAIFLTSYNNKESLKSGFLSGGDDYITKPFDVDELLFRIKAILKRVSRNEIYKVGLLEHNIDNQAFYYDKREIELKNKEYQLLILLVNNVDKIVPKDMIFDELWSSSEGGSDGAIRVYINRIKQLIPEMVLENIRGIGYKLVS